VHVPFYFLKAVASGNDSNSDLGFSRDQAYIDPTEVTQALLASAVALGCTVVVRNTVGYGSTQ